MKSTAFIFFLLISLSAAAQSPDEKEILSILENQTIAWNQGNIEKFMKGYWNNDSLMFVGQSGVTYGFRNTMNNYRKNYSDTVKMGKLFFTILQTKKLSPEYYFVLGKWFLKRSVGDLGGHYTLLFRKINGRWMIVSDHSS
jgi:hypothetical protein